MRTTTVRQHTRRVNGERVPVMRHERRLQPVSMGRVGSFERPKSLQNEVPSDLQAYVEKVGLPGNSLFPQQFREKFGVDIPPIAAQRINEEFKTQALSGYLVKRD